MKLNANARLIQPVVQGKIVDKRYDAGTDGLEYLLEYVGDDGETHQRWFVESQLEEV